MRWTGIIVLLFLFWHLADFTWGWFNPDFVRGDGVPQRRRQPVSRVPVAILYIVANIALGIHLFHGTWSLFQSMGWNNPRFNQWRRGLAAALATIIVVGNVSFPIAVLAGIVDTRVHEEIDMSVDTHSMAPDDTTRRARRQDPRRPARRQVGQLQGRRASWSTRPTSASSRSSSSAPAWPARRRRRRWPSSATRSRRSRSTTRRAGPTRSPPRAASTRRRTTRATATRSTGCSTTRSRAATSGPARATCYRLAQVSVEHHRPDGRPGRAVRPRVRRPARQPQLRRRPGQPHVLRPRPDRPAAAARRLPAAGPPGRPRQRQAVEPHRAGRRRRRRRPLRRHRHPRPAHRRDRVARRARRRARHRRLRQRLLPVDQRHGRATSRRRGAPTARAPSSPTPATRRSTRRASRSPTTSSRS